MPGIQPGISHMHPYVFFCYEAFYAFLPPGRGHHCASVCLRLFHQIVQRCHARTGCPLAFKRIGGSPHHAVPAISM